MNYETNRVQVVPGEVPARGLVAAGLVLSVLLPPVGLILTIIARRQQRQMGYTPDMVSTVALGLSFVFMVIGIILVVALIAGVIASGVL